MNHSPKLGLPQPVDLWAAVFKMQRTELLGKLCNDYSSTFFQFDFQELKSYMTCEVTIYSSLDHVVVSFSCPFFLGKRVINGNAMNTWWWPRLWFYRGSSWYVRMCKENLFAVPKQACHRPWWGWDRSEIVDRRHHGRLHASVIEGLMSKFETTLKVRGFWFAFQDDCVV